MTKRNHAYALSALTIALAAGCGAVHDGPSTTKQDANRVLNLATTAFAKLEDSGQRLTSTVEVSEPCEVAGSIAIAGDYEASSDGRASYDLTGSFNRCANSDGTLDGQLVWHSEHDSGGTSVTLDGELSWIGNDGVSASCQFDLAVTVNPGGITVTGTACGYDVRELDVDDIALPNDL